MVKNAIEFENALRRGRSPLAVEVPAPTPGWRNWWVISPGRSPEGGFSLLHYEFDRRQMENGWDVAPGDGMRTLASEFFPDIESLLERLAAIAAPEAFEYAWNTDAPV